MAAAVHRNVSASSVNLSQPQTTAPVLEYRCMFSHDVFKKQKKWHDGSLRFHTFNRRVMVYDDAKNLVGDLHYRQPEEFGEGLELKLDRPVLVQVEEQLRQTTTDLTPLLGRQKQDGTTQHTNPSPPTRATLARINAANPQIRPKSIKELLGASQGRLGRARLPGQSPFEQRQALSEIETNREPAAKRRKIIVQIEDGPTGGPSPIAPSTTKSPVGPLTVGKNVIDISSDDEQTGVSRFDPTSASTSKPTRPHQTRLDQGAIALRDTTRGQPASKRNETVEGPAHPSKTSSTKQSASKPESASSCSKRLQPASLVQSQRRVQPGPRSSLSFAPARPRQKLLCKAPAPSASMRSPVAAFTQGQTSMTDGAVPPPRRQKCTDLLDIDNEFAASQVAREAATAAAVFVTQDGQGSSGAEEMVDVPSPSHHSLEGQSLSSHDDEADMNSSQGHVDSLPVSPLFEPCQDLQESPFASQDQPDHLLRALDHLQQEKSQQSAVPETNGDQSMPDAVGDLFGDGSVESEEALQSSPGFFEPELLRRKGLLSTTDPVSAPGVPSSSITHRHASPALADGVPKAMAGLSHTPDRSFRRVVSEHLPALPPFCDEASDGEGLSRAHSSQAEASKQTSALKMQDGGLISAAPVRDIASDPVLISHVPSVDQESFASSESEEQVEGEAEAIGAGPVQEVGEASPPATDSGPWTTMEAFLLFDRWPPGKRKPDYGAGATTSRSKSGDPVQQGTRARNAAMNVMSKKYGTFGSARFVSQR